MKTTTGAKINKLVSTLEEEVRAVFDFLSYNHDKITVAVRGDKVDVQVSQMYEYVDLTFAKLKALAEVFGTEDFNMDGWSSSGCETCDYGSQYVKEFTFTLPTSKFSL